MAAALPSAPHQATRVAERTLLPQGIESGCCTSSGYTSSRAYPATAGYRIEHAAGLSREAELDAELVQAAIQLLSGIRPY